MKFKTINVILKWYFIVSNGFNIANTLALYGINLIMWYFKFFQWMLSSVMKIDQLIIKIWLI